ncbi:S-adenosylmethionine:tRNA ribosyltransferase-isomerase [Asticcacaulis biprosthecium C19]|uniref:S-adenosylmethionine:tRNA ribosyltransferase-isomerase n=1 Tax=Asticcacaulis biprosthecium C19 TaxID=715226 RepID=F4QR80_9CAUL|nr:tRNA preQ1(34) S-adenosylmethionine ribosyltransferase-isomerase QueA [Asticcacaulis biprosthecium]EGF90717.1 S-adenosylmethionine:tRNA ribosyltransferase-isomerase [Asticcacaulis biprosthecium C19]
MLVSDFDFDLPDDLIALRPAEPRESARLLRIDAQGGLTDARVGDIAAFLKSGDLLVVNDTKVLPAQLHGIRRRDGADVAIEATLIKATGATQWQAFLKPGRKVRIGDDLHFGSDIKLQATVAAKAEDGRYTLDFHHTPEVLVERLHVIGAMPLPPYIRSKRREDDQDKRDYQTVFANEEGSVAAPTAGLHFTSQLLEVLQSQGVGIERITLHVGAGTFLPMKVEDTRDHIMHAELGVISAESAARINAARIAGGRIVCVGTTSLRLLESACDPQGTIHAFASETAIFITPGVVVRSCDLVLTNFHLPKSTLFMLVSALAGTDTMKAAYRHAIETGYRFFSYGDACLIDNISKNQET